MILLDEPYISEFLRKTIADNSLAVVDNTGGRSVGLGKSWNVVSESQAVDLLAKEKWPLVYTASENCLGWIADNLKFCRLPEIVGRVKNKAVFREMVRPMYPGYFFKEAALDSLDELDLDEVKFPFVIKPTVGFFSLGVYVVQSAGQWPETLKKLQGDVSKIRNLYPAAVLDTTSYLIEEVITGREFAFDAYYDSEGKPVVLNIMEHFFAGADDVSDRVYLTSKQTILEFRGKFEKFLSDVNGYLNARNFVLHVEVRVGADGVVRPIEINPLRFGGWCTTADLTWYAYGENSYLNYLNQRMPDWDKILANADDSIYALVVLDNSTGTDGSEISAFDYGRSLGRFENVLELRKADWTRYPLFGYCFVKVSPERMGDLNDILCDDLSAYISLK